MTARDPRYPKDLRPLIRAALDAGWRWEEQRVGRHRILRSPEGVRVPVPGDTGTVLHRFRKQMTVLGIVEPPKGHR